jgi:hypothetical protein
MGMGGAAERIETLNARPSLAAALAARQQSYSAKGEARRIASNIAKLPELQRRA